MRQIKTKRLLLRPTSDEEMRAAIEAEQDLHMKKALGEMLAGSQADPANRLFYANWEIRLRDGSPVGSLCFKGPPVNGEVEIGYGIDAPFERQGYCTEAARAIIDWAFSKESVYFVAAETEPDNAASQRILEKLHFIKNGEGAEGPRFLLEKPASQWMAIYMSIGVSLGIAIGSIIENLSLGIGIGLPLGLSVGAALDASDRKKRATLRAARSDAAK